MNGTDLQYCETERTNQVLLDGEDEIRRLCLNLSRLCRIESSLCDVVARLASMGHPRIASCRAAEDVREIMDKVTAQIKEAEARTRDTVTT